MRALKYNAGVAKGDLDKSNSEAVLVGRANLQKHIDNLKNVFGLPVVVAINHFASDSQDELDVIVKLCHQWGVRFALSDVWANGGVGGIDLAKQVLALLQEKFSHFRFAYDHRLPLIDKINQVAKTIYGADGVDFSDTALARLKEFEKVSVDNLPICIAKTQYSLSDNAKLLGRPTGFRITVRDLSLSAGRVLWW